MEDINHADSNDPAGSKTLVLTTDQPNSINQGEEAEHSNYQDAEAKGKSGLINQGGEEAEHSISQDAEEKGKSGKRERDAPLRLRRIAAPQTPAEHFIMFHRICEVVRRKKYAMTTERAEWKEMRSKLLETNVMFVKNEVELEYVAYLDFKGDVFIGRDVSTDEVDYYKHAHDEVTVVDKVVLTRKVRA